MPKDQQITKQTLLEDLFNNPKAMGVLEKYNFPCLGCPMAAFEMGVLKLGDVAKAYGIDIEKLVQDINLVMRKKETKKKTDTKGRSKN